MKKSDIATIVLIASISVMLSFFIAKSIFGDVYNGSATVKTIEPITSEVIEPNKDIFKENAINPTIPIDIVGTDTSSNTGS